MIGAATAYALRQSRPSLRLVIVEAERLAYGASGRNAGFLMPGTHRDAASAVEAYGAGRAGRMLEFTLENVRRVEALARKTGSFAYEGVGHRLAAGMPGEAERLEASAAILEAAGVPARVFGGAEGSRRAGGEGFDAVLEYDAGGTLDPARLVRTLVGLSGASLLERWPVAGVEPAGAGVRLGGPEGARLEVPRALFAMNAYLPRLLPRLSGIVRPVRAQLLCTESVAPALDRPVYSHEGFFYIRQRWDGRVLAGGARHLHEAQEVGYEDVTTAALQEDLAAYLRDHFPRVAGVRVDRRWSGAMGFSPDGLPVVGAVPGVEGAIYAGGFTGHGMGYSMRFGELLAARLMEEGDEADDLFSDARLQDRAIERLSD